MGPGCSNESELCIIAHSDVNMTSHLTSGRVLNNTAVEDVTMSKFQSKITTFGRVVKGHPECAKL